jgi:hypothetical protein
MGSHPNQHRAFVSRVKGLSQEELKDHFGAFGSVTDVYFPVDKETGMPKSIAFVTFAVRLQPNATPPACMRVVDIEEQNRRLWFCLACPILAKWRHNHAHGSIYAPNCLPGQCRASLCVFLIGPCSILTHFSACPQRTDRRVPRGLPKGGEPHGARNVDRGHSSRYQARGIQEQEQSAVEAG